MTAASTLCHLLQSSNLAAPIANEIRLFARCRDEILRLPAFLAYYRNLGVDRFFVVDNDSTDGTDDFLASQPDVHLFRTANRYSESGMGIAWIHALLAAFGSSCWCLTVDIDELLVFPQSENLSLRTLIRYLDDHDFDAFACLLLDLYPSEPLSQCSYTAGESLLAAAPFFDPGPYQRIPVGRCPGVLIHGGMRERLFFPEFRARGIASRIYDAILYNIVFRLPVIRRVPSIRGLARAIPPCLTKVPLVRWNAGDQYLQSTHFVSPKKVASDTGALLHLKFLQDFHQRAVEEVQRGEHWNNASDYRRYARLLDQRPDLTMMHEGSIRFESTAQLVQLGLINETADWREYLSRNRNDVGKSPIAQ